MSDHWYAIIYVYGEAPGLSPIMTFNGITSFLRGYYKVNSGREFYVVIHQANADHFAHKQTPKTTRRVANKVSKK